MSCRFYYRLGGLEQQGAFLRTSARANRVFPLDRPAGRQNAKKAPGGAFRWSRTELAASYVAAVTPRADCVMSTPRRSRLNRMSTAITTATVPATIAIAIP